MGMGRVEGTLLWLGLRVGCGWERGGGGCAGRYPMVSEEMLEYVTGIARYKIDSSGEGDPKVVLMVSEIYIL